MSTSGNVRRSSRLKARSEEQRKVYKYYDDEEDSSDISDVTTKKELEDIEENIQKPVELFSDDDVSGKKLFGFQTPSKKNAMTEKANLSRTVHSTKVPKVLSEAKVVLEKINLDNKYVKKLDPNSKTPYKTVSFANKRHMSGLSSSESESVSEPSDFVPSGDDTDDDTEESDCIESSEDEIKPKVVNHKNVSQMKLLSTPKRVGGRNKPAIVYKDFHMRADDYFEIQSEKSITSDRTLERLRNSRLTKEKLEELLTNQNHVTTRHKEHLYSLTENYMSLFPMWDFIMEEGYTVLLHGLGSKRCLINDFQKYVADHPSIVVNGFFPSLAIKDVLDNIIIELLGLTAPANASECLDIIENILKENPKDKLYLLIHNIDGIMLRSNKAQDLLSSLASVQNLHVLASVDHINAPLLWDHVKRSKFNFFWWDTSTFLPYQEETCYESSLLVQQSGALALSSLHNVFLSLTSNAKAIYILLAKYQLDNNNNTNFTGMAFKDLYRSAREGFLVSSDLALRAQLTEFIDHKLVKTKRSIDGVEYLVIPWSNGLLKQFLDEHEA